MTIPSRPIGQDPQSQLLWNISKQIDYIQKLISPSAPTSGVTIANGDDEAEGHTTDAYNLATDGTAVTQIALLKALSYLLQHPTSSPTTIIDGGDVTLGAKADARSVATDTTPITLMQAIKEISYMEQNPASRAVTNAGTFAIQITDDAATAANTARTAASKVILVQNIDAEGNVGAGMTAIDDAAFGIATEKGNVIMAVATVDQVNDGDKGALKMNLDRELATYSSHSYLPATHWSPADGALTYLGVNSLTCTGFPFTVDAACAIRSLGVTNASNVLTMYENGVNGISIYAAANVIYILKYGASFTAFLNTDLSYKAAISYQEKTYDATSDANKTAEISPLSAQYVQDSIIDAAYTTTGPTGINYYPSAVGMSMDGSKSIFSQGYIIEGDAVLDTVEFQICTDEDPTDVNSWETIFFFSPKLNAQTNIISTGSVAGTYKFTIDAQDLNTSYVRWKVTTADVSYTLNIKARRIY